MWQIANIYLTYGVSERRRIRLVPLFLPDTRPELRIPGLDLFTFSMGQVCQAALGLGLALAWGKRERGKTQARGGDEMRWRFHPLTISRIACSRNNSGTTSHSSTPNGLDSGPMSRRCVGQWHHAPVHGQPEPFFGKMENGKITKLEVPNRQAVRCRRTARIGRPVGPCHDVAGLDFPHAILVCWGALGGFCTRVLQAAPPPARAMPCAASKHTMQTPTCCPRAS